MADATDAPATRLPLKGADVSEPGAGRVRFAHRLLAYAQATLAVALGVDGRPPAANLVVTHARSLRFLLAEAGSTPCVDAPRGLAQR